MPNNCKSPEMCLLSETCVPCAICPNAKTPMNRPIFISDNDNGYNGTTAYLTFGQDSRDFVRLRIQVEDGATRQKAAETLRLAADQLEDGNGSMIRHGEQLFEC